MSGMNRISNKHANNIETTVTRERNDALTITQSNCHRYIYKSVPSWIRLSMIILTIFLFCLSTAYCIGQLYETKLHLITKCSPKTMEEIWYHSYLSSLKDIYQTQKDGP
eukprot:380963_1